MPLRPRPFLALALLVCSLGLAACMPRSFTVSLDAERRELLEQRIIGGDELDLPAGTYTINILSAPDIQLDPITITAGEAIEVTID